MHGHQSKAGRARETKGRGSRKRCCLCANWWLREGGMVKNEWKAVPSPERVVQGSQGWAGRRHGAGDARTADCEGEGRWSTSWRGLSPRPTRAVATVTGPCPVVVVASASLISRFDPFVGIRVVLGRPPVVGLQEGGKFLRQPNEHVSGWLARSHGGVTKRCAGPSRDRCRCVCGERCS